MKYYRMTRKIDNNSTLLDQVSHEMVEFSTGNFLPKDFKGPLIVKLDEEFIDGELSTFYTDPALIGTKDFYLSLKEVGVDNIETHSVVIQNRIKNITIDRYLLLNIIGRISCAEMDQSEYHALGDGMNIINKLIIDPKKTYNFDLFLVHEDTDCILISERIYDHLQRKGYSDIFFEAVSTL